MTPNTISVNMILEHCRVGRSVGRLVGLLGITNEQTASTFLWVTKLAIAVFHSDFFGILSMMMMMVIKVGLEKASIDTMAAVILLLLVIIRADRE